MRNRLISGIALILLGVLLALGPQTIFPVCGVHKESTNSMQSSIATQSSESEMSSAKMTSKMKCYWTARTEIGIGAMIAVIGVLLLLIGDSRIRIGLSIAALLNSFFSASIPTILIGVCGSKHMSCNKLALPAILILSSFTAVLLIINIIYLFKTHKQQERIIHNE